LSFDIFENESHAMRAAGLTQKTFLYFVFLKKNVV